MPSSDLEGYKNAGEKKASGKMERLLMKNQAKNKGNIVICKVKE